MDNENRDMKVKASYGPNSTYKIMIPSSLSQLQSYTWRVSYDLRKQQVWNSSSELGERRGSFRVCSASLSLPGILSQPSIIHKSAWDLWSQLDVRLPSPSFLHFPACLLIWFTNYYSEDIYNSEETRWADCERETQGKSKREATKWQT